MNTPEESSRSGRNQIANCTNKNCRHSYLRYFWFFIFLGSVAEAPWLSLAQVALDGTLGRSGPLSGPAYQITADLGRQVGPNLFHSFSQFNLGSGQSATFSGPGEVQNILTRVTGGSPSLIDGLIKSTIPGANFYLLNPAGVLFKENATIDVSGSFVAATADYLKLGDGGRFDASHPDASVLTTSPPTAFGFLDATPAAIQMEGSQLSVGEGKSLALIGGDLDIKGGALKAPAGQVSLLSAESKGEAALPTSAGSPNFSVFPQQGKITVSQGANVEVSGAGGGRIVIRGGKLVMDNSVVQAQTSGDISGGGVDLDLADKLEIRDGVRVRTSTATVASGGDMRVKAPHILASDDSSIAAITALGESTGRGGAVIVTTEKLELINGGRIAAITQSQGDGGNVTVTANTLLVDNQDSTAFTGLGTQTQADKKGGRGGDLSLRADTIGVFHGGEIAATTLGSGRSGNLTVNAKSIQVDRQGSSYLTDITTQSVLNGGSGDSGHLTIDTGCLQVLNGGEISTKAIGDGNAGDLIIKARSIVIDRKNSSDFTGLSTAATDLFSAGRSGNIAIVDADHLTILKGGVISASTASNGDSGKISVQAKEVLIDGQEFTDLTGIDASNANFFGKGRAGDISLDTDRIEILNRGTIQSLNFGSGRGGNLAFKSKAIRIDGKGSRDFTGIGGPAVGLFGGSAGNITLDLENGRLELVNGGQIDSSTLGLAAGGNVSVNAKQIHIAGQKGTLTGIFTDSLSSHPTAKGGNISITAAELDVVTGGEISTKSSKAADGGSIDISVSHTLALADGSAISASAVLAKGGDISFQGSANVEIKSSRVTTQAGRDGGNISLRTPGLFYLLDGEVTAEAKEGKGGDLSIASNVAVLNHSRLLAKAQVGQGGNITLAAQSILQSVDSELNASAEVGVDGFIEVLGPIIDLTGSLVALSSALVDAESHLPERCAVRLPGNFSSFVISGRGGLPLEPGDWQPSFLRIDRGDERPANDELRE